MYNNRKFQNWKAMRRKTKKNGTECYKRYNMHMMKMPKEKDRKEDTIQGLVVLKQMLDHQNVELRSSVSSLI